MLKKGLNLLFPPLCPITDEPVEASGMLSAEGWRAIQFISEPACAGCGAPFEYAHGEDARCGACLAWDLGLKRVKAAVVYDDASHKLIVSYKHSDRTEYAPMFAAWMRRAGESLLTEGRLITPVPLHPRRLMARRFNQSGILARLIAAEAPGDFAPDLLVRSRPTKSQQRLSAEARRRNVAASFEVPEAMSDRIADADVILVDDVLTTGATLNACARTLKRSGAKNVYGLVLARVVKTGVDAI